MAALVGATCYFQISVHVWVHASEWKLLHLETRWQYYSGVRLRFYAYNKSLCKWGHFEKAKTTFKMLLATWFLVCFFKRFRSFVAENLESVGQRAAKLPAIKLWEWFEGAGVRTRADWLTGAGAGWQTFSWDLQLWQLVTLRPFDQKIPNL